MYIRYLTSQARTYGRLSIALYATTVAATLFLQSIAAAAATLIGGWYFGQRLVNMHDELRRYTEEA